MHTWIIIVAYMQIGTCRKAQHCWLSIEILLYNTLMVV